MAGLTDRVNARNVVRWSLVAMVLGLMASMFQDFRAGYRLPDELEVVRFIGTLAFFGIAILLFRARHDTPRRKFPYQVGMATVAMLQVGLVMGSDPRYLAMLAVWAMCVWVEWHRVLDQDRQSA